MPLFMILGPADVSIWTLPHHESSTTSCSRIPDVSGVRDNNVGVTFQKLMSASVPHWRPVAINGLLLSCSFHGAKARLDLHFHATALLIYRVRRPYQTIV